jgi:hypothetical protein
MVLVSCVVNGGMGGREAIETYLGIAAVSIVQPGSQLKPAGQPVDKSVLEMRG